MPVTDPQGVTQPTNGVDSSSTPQEAAPVDPAALIQSALDKFNKDLNENLEKRFGGMKDYLLKRIDKAVPSAEPAQAGREEAKPQQTGAPSNVDLSSWIQ